SQGCQGGHGAGGIGRVVQFVTGNFACSQSGAIGAGRRTVPADLGRTGFCGRCNLQCCSSGRGRRTRVFYNAVVAASVACGGAGIGQRAGGGAAEGGAVAVPLVADGGSAGGSNAESRFGTFIQDLVDRLLGDANDLVNCQGERRAVHAAGAAGHLAGVCACAARSGIADGQAAAVAANDSAVSVPGINRAGGAADTQAECGGL